MGLVGGVVSRFDRRRGGGNGGPSRSSALGSGFVISADGFIVTNNHVIEGADEIEIEFFSGETLAAKVIGTDKNTDIAVLKVKSDSPLPFVGFGDSNVSRVGDWVLAIGNPLGQGFSVSAGIISARERSLRGTYDDYIQTDAAINKGQLWWATVQYGRRCYWREYGDYFTHWRLHWFGVFDVIECCDQGCGPVERIW